MRHGFSTFLVTLYLSSLEYIVHMSALYSRRHLTLSECTFYIHQNVYNIKCEMEFSSIRHTESHAKKKIKKITKPFEKLISSDCSYFICLSKAPSSSSSQTSLFIFFFFIFIIFLLMLLLFFHNFRTSESFSVSYSLFEHLNKKKKTI